MERTAVQALRVYSSKWKWILWSAFCIIKWSKIGFDRKSNHSSEQLLNCSQSNNMKLTLRPKGPSIILNIQMVFKFKTLDLWLVVMVVGCKRWVKIDNKNYYHYHYYYFSDGPLNSPNLVLKFQIDLYPSNCGILPCNWAWVTTKHKTMKALSTVDKYNRLTGQFFFPLQQKN